MLRLAIVGVGGYGIFHLQSCAALEVAGLVKVDSITDPSEAALEKARRLLPTARCHPDYDTLLDQAEIDAVVLATPIPLHEEMALKAIRRGLYVLLEKPAVPLYSQWENLLQADARGRVAVAFQRISSPGVRAVRKMIERGELGTLRSLSAFAVWPRSTRYYQRAAWAGQLEWKSRPVLDGPMTNGLAHYLNDMMYLAGPQPDCFGIPDKVCGEVYRARPIPSYDTAFLRGSFPCGARFAAGFSHASARTSQARLRVEGSKGMVWVEQDGSLSSEDFNLEAFSVSDGRDEMWRDFVEFASGRCPRPSVLLRDVEGYTLATNLMLQSAGEIRSIPEPFARDAIDEKGGEVVAIEQINEILAKAADSYHPLFEAGAIWAKDGKWVSSADFSESAMRAELAAQEPASEVRTLAEA